MTQDDVAGKILLDLLNNEIIEEKSEFIVFQYLQQAFAAGSDSGRQILSNRKMVAQYSRNGEPLKIFESVADASRKTRAGRSEIVRCAKGKAHTAGGYKWEYVKNEAAPDRSY